jgi:DNA modification methylase
MNAFPIPRLDKADSIRNILLPFCRLKQGNTWIDPQGKHVVGCTDATSPDSVSGLFAGRKANLAIHDPPYNLVAFEERDTDSFIEWCGKWIDNTDRVLCAPGALYVWLGADQNKGFGPLPDFMLMMRSKISFSSRSFITMRNQRGYGTQKNWMAVRQELLYYTKGEPSFDVNAEYTDIPKILRGYYKNVGGDRTENLERGKSDFIRAGNVWVDIQQVFYRMEENVNGCYAQKPLKCIERIVRASSKEGDTVADFFSHSGTTLLVSEIHNRRCVAIDIDPLFCEISIRRIEHFRETGKTGWQNGNPFERELESLGIRSFDDNETPVCSDADKSQPEKSKGLLPF